jgi:dipeptidyl aminopeptidase/acylaminoacyl peptidase
MNEDRLRALLDEVPVPDAERAERRGLAMARAAFVDRPPPSRNPSLSRLAVAFAAATLLAALLLSPAGAAVRDWIDDTFIAGVPDAEPALTEVPGGGRLLVQSTAGPWVVQPDGSRRLLGRYEEATWSPRGLFVAATTDHGLSAVEPDGTVHWSISAKAPVSDPRWSPSGFRIAYRAGQALRVVAGDGSGDQLLDRMAAPLPAVWSPLGPHLLAYVGSGNGLRAVNADTGDAVAADMAQPGIRILDWASDGQQLLEATRRSLWIRDVTIGKLASRLRFGEARRVHLTPGAAVRSASFSPGGQTVAVLLRFPARGPRPPRSEVALIDPAGGSMRTQLGAPGNLSDLAWSPDGSRLLIGWPDADQWLFTPVGPSRRVRAIGDISAEFAPGAQRDAAAFPRIEGWCCPARIDPIAP